MIGLINMYISWPVLIVIIIVGIGLGVLLGLLIKNRPYTDKGDRGYKSFGTSSIGGISGSITTDYEYENNNAHEEMKKKLQQVELENTKLKNEQVVLKEQVDLLKERLKYAETKLNQIAKELKKDEHPIYNRVIKLAKMLASNLLNANQSVSVQQMTVSNNSTNTNNISNLNNNTQTTSNIQNTNSYGNIQIQNNQTINTIGNEHKDNQEQEDTQDLISEAISDGYIQQEDSWCDSDGNKIADSTEEFLEYLRNLKNLQQNSRVK